MFNVTSLSADTTLTSGLKHVLQDVYYAVMVQGRQISIFYTTIANVFGYLVWAKLQKYQMLVYPQK